MRLLFYIANSLVVLAIIFTYIFKDARWTYTVLTCSLGAAAVTAVCTAIFTGESYG
jgi:hypothetical protein